MSTFLADEHFPISSTYLLRALGYEVAAIVEDSPGVKDIEVMARAAQEQRVILTFDRDYGELIYRLRLPTPAGVIHLRFIPATPEEAGQRLSFLLRATSVDGYYTVVDGNQIRQRKLP